MYFEVSIGDIVMCCPDAPRRSIVGSTAGSTIDRNLSGIPFREIIASAGEWPCPCPGFSRGAPIRWLVRLVEGCKSLVTSAELGAILKSRSSLRVAWEKMKENYNEQSVLWSSRKFIHLPRLLCFVQTAKLLEVCFSHYDASPWNTLAFIF